MAYQVPKTWSHGDRLTHTELNKYRDGQNAIHDRTGDHLYLQLVSISNEHIPQRPEDNFPLEGSRLIFQHRYRWLYFKSSGEINDMDLAEDPVSLTDDDSSDVTLFDLDDVPWLSYGQIYAVIGVRYACEFDYA